MLVPPTEVAVGVFVGPTGVLVRVGVFVGATGVLVGVFVEPAEARLT